MNFRAMIFPPPPQTPASAGLLLLRGFAGVAMAVHGWGKIQDPFHHLSKGDPFGKWELAALYLCVSVLVLLGGPGRFSLDALLRSRLEPTAGR